MCFGSVEALDYADQQNQKNFWKKRNIESNEFFDIPWPNFADSGENKVLDRNAKRLWTGCQFRGSFYQPGFNSRKQTNRTLHQISQL